MDLYRVTDYEIQALVDGELSPEEREYVLSAIKLDADARERYEQLQGQKRLLKSWWFKGKQ